MAKYTARIDIIDYNNDSIIKWYDLDRMESDNVNKFHAYASEISVLLNWPIIKKDDSRVIIEHPDAYKTR